MGLGALRFSIIIVFFTAISKLVTGEIAVPDSLLQKLNTGNKTDQVDAILEIADLTVDSAIYYNSVTNYLKTALQFSEELKDTSRLIKVFNYSGLADFTIGNYESATDFFYRSLKLAELSSDSNLISVATHNLGMVYDELEEFDEAISFYQKSMEYEKHNNDTNNIIISYINLSISYQNKIDLETAEDYCNKALELAQATNDSISIVTVVNNLGTIFYDRKQYDESLNYYQEGLKLYRTLNDKDGIATSYNNIGLVYLDKKDYPKAKTYFYKALKLAKELKLYDFSGDIYSNLSFYYKETGDYKNAYYYYDKYNEVYDSLIGEKKNKLIRQLQAKYQAEKKQRQILQLEQQTGQQKLIIKNARAVQLYLIIVAVVIISLLVLVLLMLRKEKRLADQLKNTTEELRKINHSKDKFFSIIAHDLRNPFHALKGYTELLKKGFHEFSKEDIQQILEDLDESTNQSFNLLQNLLYWTRSQTDRVQIFKSTFDLCPLIEEIIKLAQPNAQKKNQKLFYSIESDCLLEADRDMIATIIRNLVFNAIKFSEEGKEIQINASVNDGKIAIVVIDKGIGISEEKQKHLFSLEENISTCGTLGETGSGLGLILCKEFAEKNGGTVEVKSELGKGSVFTVYLPCVNLSTSTNG